MRAGTDARIILVAPVSEVVPAFRARPGVVGDFVGGQAAGCRALLCQFEQACRSVCIERLELMLRNHRREPCARLDGQLIKRQMFCPEAKRPVQGLGPALFVIAGKGIDQVEADAADRGLRRLERAQPFLRRMGASEKSERFVVEALQAEADPIDPCA